jgi:hypothetical protein
MVAVRGIPESDPNKLVRPGLGDVALIICEMAWKPTPVRCRVNLGQRITGALKESEETVVTIPSCIPKIWG